MNAPNAKDRACLGKFGRPSPPTSIEAPSPAAIAPATTETRATQTIAQMLPGLIFKSAHHVRFGMPILSNAECGTFKSFRKPGTVILLANTVMVCAPRLRECTHRTHEVPVLTPREVCSRFNSLQFH